MARRASQRQRRVIVKARIVRTRLGSGAAGAHLRYLERDRTTRDGKRGRLYGPERDREDLARLSSAATVIGIPSA